MSETIQAPKRKYTRKPKVVEPVVEINVSDSDESSASSSSTLSTDSGMSPPPPQKPKRQYKKKTPVEIPPPPVLERQTNNIRDETELIDSEPETEVVKPVKEKKPRTEKQQAAFQKMRDARLAKTEELKKLKEIEKEHKLLEKEQSKLDTITEKVVEKAAAIKQRKTKKPAAEKFDVLPEPQYVPQVQEKKPREIVFV
jgi:hypothetical protein